MQTHLRVHTRLETLSAGAARRPWRVLAIAALVSTAALTGCVVAPAGPGYGYNNGYNNSYGNGYNNGYGDFVTANVAPPPAYVETMPVAPVVGSIWIGGFWDWDSGRHVWRPGHYERPRHGFTYRQPGWRAGPNGQWMLHRGGWEQHR